MDMTIYDITYEDDHTELYNILVNPALIIDPVNNDLTDGMYTELKIFLQNNVINKFFLYNFKQKI